MLHPIDSLATMLLDAADAPDLRAKVAELEAVVTTLTKENARLERELKRAQEGMQFYYEGFAGKQLKIAEDTWGLPGGG